MSKILTIGNVSQSTTILIFAVSLFFSLPTTQAKAQRDLQGYLSNKLSGKCLDVAGAPGVDHGDNVQLAGCELTGEYQGTPTDQIWEFVEGGFIRNKLSGKCLDVAGAPGVDHGDNVQLAGCELTGEYQGTPTDQTWELVRGGFIRNKLSGKCLDVAGAPGVNHGTNVQLAKCEFTADVTDQRWEFVSGRESERDSSGSSNSIIRKASVSNPPPGNVLNYYGIKACFLVRNVPKRTLFVGKVHQGYCNYAIYGREERAEDYYVVMSVTDFFWRRDEQGIRQARNEVGGRPVEFLEIAEDQGVCGVRYRGGYHVGLLKERVCTIGYGGESVEFEWGDFDFVLYAK
ncbi:MAG: ricin-type beta-trefoil lectin domain protein [Oscillatoria sp. SIO1A7]|nr:ricin-type beta-trefoil lectin domain protein [Oscillatoria sp. SIO1A7]